MPRFSQTECRIMIEMAKAFEASTPNLKVKGHHRSIIRKTQQSDDHHARIVAERVRKS